MVLSFKQYTKNGKAAIFTGAATQVRIGVKAFADGQAPAEFEVADGVFAPAKAKLSAEERKAARANKPKPTLAERLKKQEERTARLRAKAQAEGVV